MLLATTADQVGVAAAIDTELGDRQNPNLVHTTGHTMTGVSPFEWTRGIDQAAGTTVTAAAVSSKALGDR